MIQRELTTEDYVAMLRRRWPLILILALVGAPLAYGVSRFLPNRYQSETLVLIEQPTVPTDFVRPVANADINQRLATMEKKILSGAALERIIRRFGLYPDSINRVPMEQLAAALRKNITVAPIRATDESQPNHVPGFYVRVVLDKPHTAQDVCTAVTSMFIEESSRRRQEQTGETTKFLDQQIAEAKTKLDEQDSRLAAFQSRHLGALPEDATMNLNVLAGLTSQLDATTQALTRAQQDKSLAESMLTQQIAARQASQTGKNPETFEEQLAALQTQLAGLQARYTDDYPDVIKTKTEIEAMKKKIAEFEDHNNAETSNQGEGQSTQPLQFVQLRAQIRADEQAIAQKTKEQERIQEDIKRYQARIQASPDTEQEYKQLTRDHQTAVDIYNNLLKKGSESLMATDLERLQEGEQFRVLDPATLPNEPVFPNRPLFALGGFGGGLALGVGLALLLEMRDTSLRTERDVEISLRLPVLAMVPIIEPLSGKKPNQISEQFPARSDIGAAGARA